MSLEWLTAALSLAGVVLNIHGYRICFALWGVSNAAWCAIDLYHGIVAQATLQAVYFGLSVYGLWKWGTPKR